MWPATSRSSPRPTATPTRKDTNAANAPTNLSQTNTSSVFSTANVAGPQYRRQASGVTSSAVGNNVQVVHYSTSP